MVKYIGGLGGGGSNYGEQAGRKNDRTTHYCNFMIQLAVIFQFVKHFIGVPVTPACDKILLN